MATTTTSTKNSKKKKNSNVINDALLEKMVDTKVRKKMEQMEAESIFEIPEDTNELLQEDEAQREIDETWAIDIFEDVGGECAAKGDTATYRIVKDNEFLANRRHPYSYEQLQKEFGGGHYRIIARSHATQKYIKQQSRFVAAPPSNEKESSRHEDRHESFNHYPNMNIPNGPNFMELLTFMKTLSDGQVREAKQIGKESSAVQTQMVSMINESNRTTNDLMMKMQQANLDMISKLTENTSKIFEKMDDKFSRLITESMRPNQKEEKGPDAFTLLKMMQDAEDRGFKRMEMIANLGKAEAEERYELYKELEGENGDKGSMLNTLVKAMIPLITQTSNVTQAVPYAPRAPQTAHPMITPPQHQQPRGNLLRQAQTTRDPHAEIKTKNPAIAQKAQVKQPNRQPASINQTLGLASLGSANKHQKVNAASRSKNIEELFNEANNLQRAMATLAVPKLAESMAANHSPEQAASIVHNELKSNQFSSEQVLENFTFDFVWQIARSFGIDETKKMWFERFYANFKIANSNTADKGQSTPTSEGIKS